MHMLIIVALTYNLYYSPCSLDGVDLFIGTLNAYYIVLWGSRVHYNTSILRGTVHTLCVR